MFTTTPAPTLSTATATTTQSPPTSPTRTSRLRGLSYLRNYTQNLHGRSDSDSNTRNTRPAFPRARSQPSSDSVRNQNSSVDSTPQHTPASAGFAPSSIAPARRAPSPPGTNTNTNSSSNTTTAASSGANTNNNAASNGWVPGGNTNDGTNRSRIRQQSTSTEAAPSSDPAPTITTPAESLAARVAVMTRSRADTAGPVLTVRNQNGPRSSSADNTSANASSDSTQAGKGNPLPSIRFIPHFDPRANRPSLSFPAVTRTLPTQSSIIKVGRYSERENAPENLPANPNTPSSAPVGFKSKVVSRRHCEFWCQNSQWYVRDVKSSSGTFLNHVRLSPPGQESRAFAVNDGDVVQLGIDFRGGEEMIFRCVKIRIECNRGWQKHLNNFNKKTHKQLLARQKGKKDTPTRRDSDTASVNSSECSICLMSIAPCQSLFVAPCSHVWHYKCIRPILNGHTWPNFLCPNCRAVADLEADVDEQEDVDEGEWEEDDDGAEAVEDSTQAGSSAAATAGASSGRVVDEPEGLRTPRAMQPIHHPDSTAEHDDDDDLSHLALQALSLAETTTRSHPSSEDDSPHEEEEEDEHATQIDASLDAESSSSGAAATGARNIPTPSRTLDLSPSRALQAEAVLTPRNDVGPFVLDGGAGRMRGERES